MPYGRQLQSVAVLLTLSFQTITTLASGTPAIVCDSVECNAGEQITVNVSVENNPGFTYLEMTPVYSSELTFVKVTNGELISDFTKGKQYVWSADDDVTTDGVLMTFTFDVAKTVASGDYSVGFIVRTCGNFNEESVEFAVQSGKVTVKGKDVAVAGVSLNKKTLSLDAGASETLLATVSPSNATNKNVNWKSSNTSVATVDNNAKVTAVKKGTATITVTTADGGFTDVCTVNVACSHANKSDVAQKDSDCKNRGWDAYSKCDDCGQIFDENGKTELSEIPFRPLSEHHKGGTATCTSKAVCTVCGNSYGSTLDHSYTAEKTKAEALKTAGNCRDKAVYYYSCSACGKVENNDSHTFLGDKVAANHVGGTVLVNQVEANHKTQTDGYSGDVKCLGCSQIIAYGHTVSAGTHTPADAWSTDDDYHWKKCVVDGCEEIIDKGHHSGGTATCANKAVCSVCDTEYGAKNPDNHTGVTEIKNAVNATCTSDGYTGDVYCKDCGEKLSDGWIIPAGHKIVKVPAVAATHDNNGNIEYYMCTGCGKLFADEEATAEITLADTVIAKGEHSYSDIYESDSDNHWKVCDCGKIAEKDEHSFGDWTVTKEPTENTMGVRERVCSVCGYKMTEDIPELSSEVDTEPEDTNKSDTVEPDDETTVDNMVDETTVDNAKGDSASSDAPKTGDVNGLFIWLVLLVISGGGLTTMVFFKKRRVHN